MATVKFVLYKSNKRKDGSYPVCLRVSKKGKLKYIDLKLSSLEGQWNEDTCRFKNHNRVNPNYELYNGLLSPKKYYPKEVFGRACRLDFESV